jgi:metacaspase-1
MTRNLSINIGLNRVDPNKYEGWDGLLSGCINDANAMRAVATRQGFSSLRLIDAEATRAAVIRAVAEAAKTLESGDTLLLTYSGHGGQVPDKNSDDADGRDETWVLYDGMLIDDELYQLWSSFQPGVRIIMISDSCHSGTVLRMTAFREALTSQIPLAGRSSMGVRLIPPQVATAVYNAHPEIYEAAQFSAFRGDRANVGASVILLSGCQDDQLSGDTGEGGVFTLTMLDVWRNGNFSGGYKDFVNQIKSLMPQEQQPNFATTGRKDPEFEGEKPFTVIGEKDSTNGSNGNYGYDIRRLRELENENHRLKQMYADLSLENRAMKDWMAKNSTARYAA